MSFLVSVFKPLAYLSLPVILIRSISQSSPIGRYYVRIGVYLSTLAMVATCSVFVAAGLTILGRQFDGNFVVARTFYAIVSRALDLRIKVEGEEQLDNQPAVLMMNHQSMLDIMMVGRLMPKRTSMMAKKSLQYSPLGPFMTLSGAIFVDRGNNARAVKSLAAAANLMRSLKVSLWMFPEGTRHCAETNSLLPFKKGGFHLAIQAGIPIIPIVTENYWRLYRKGVFDTGTIRVRVLPPVPTIGLTAADVPALSTRVHDQMLQALREISVVPSGQPEKSEESVRDNISQPVSDEPAAPAPTTQLADAPPGVAGVPLEPGRGSSVSLASSSASSSNHWRSEASENGGETEEDEGMILVGRPA